LELLSPHLLDLINNIYQFLNFLAVKRLMREAQELAEPTYDYFAQPLSDNLFEWHFTVRGPADTDYDGGVYHGRIVLPPDYPMKPPNIIVLTVYSLPIIKYINCETVDRQ
jgi:ubiquitin-protein ligase